MFEMSKQNHYHELNQVLPNNKQRESSGDAYGFYRYGLQIYYGLFLKEYFPRTQERLERDCLEHYRERLSSHWSIIQASLLLLTGEAEIISGFALVFD